MRAGGVDAVLCGNARPFGPLCHGLARRAAVPLVLVFHGNDLLAAVSRARHPFRRIRWKRLVAAADLIAVNSRFTARLAEDAGLGARKIAVIPPEVDTGRFRPAANDQERGELRRRFGWEGEVITLFVGRLVPRKGLLDLVEALPEVPGARLAVAGPGERAEIARAAREAGVRDRVTLLGDVPEAELPLLYRAADLFAGPSRDSFAEGDVEGFGIVYLEAAASGIPVLATRTGGVREAVRAGDSAILVPPGDRRALVAAWNRLCADADLRQRLGRAGLEGPAADHAAGSSARALLEALRGIARP
jgi:phosphatidylinositol alpha-1,6-mannosyltransferase